MLPVAHGGPPLGRRVHRAKRRAPRDRSAAGDRGRAAPRIVPALTGTAQAASTSQPRVIELTAKRFEFTPSEVRLTKGEPVTLRIASKDVTHGLYMKSLGIDAEIERGKTTEVSFTPQVAGRFTAICDHFCGAGHGNMHMVFVVE